MLKYDAFTQVEADTGAGVREHTDAGQVGGDRRSRRPIPAEEELTHIAVVGVEKSGIKRGRGVVTGKANIHTLPSGIQGIRGADVIRRIVVIAIVDALKVGFNYVVIYHAVR